MNYEEIKRRISIRAYLAAQGILPRWERGNRGMYLSPLREERTASFSVSYDKNLWHDFGTGEVPRSRLPEGLRRANTERSFPSMPNRRERANRHHPALSSSPTAN